MVPHCIFNTSRARRLCAKWSLCTGMTYTSMLPHHANMWVLAGLAQSCYLGSFSMTEQPAEFPVESRSMNGHTRHVAAESLQTALSPTPACLIAVNDHADMSPASER